MRNWLDPQTETSLLDEVAQRRQRLSAQRRSVTPQQGQLAEQYADAYPWMNPSVVGSMTQSGVPADSPNAQSVADLAAQQAAEDGEFDNPADDVPGPWYETLLEAATGWAKPVVRRGFTVLATPMEELQALLSSAGAALFDETEAGELGLLSNLGENIGAVVGELARPDELVSDFWTNYTQKAARSSGLLAIGDLLKGETPQLGEGYLPGPRFDPETGEELPSIFREREEAKWRLTLDGHFVTPGRLISRQLLEPGSGAWNFHSGLTDAAQQIVADPIAVATGGLSKAAQANRAFQTVGAIWGTRKTVDPARAVNHYLTSKTGQRLVDWLTKNDDVDSVWQAIGRTDLDTAGRLARSTSHRETFDVLSDTLGTVIREKPTAGFAGRAIGGIGGNEYGRLFGGGARARRSLANVRMGLDMPRSLINPHDMNDAAIQLDRWMKNARLGDDVRRKHIDQMSRLIDGDSIGLFNVAKSVMDDTAGVLVKEAGIEVSRAQRLTRMYSDLADELRAFGFDALGRHEDVLGPFRINVDGSAQVLPKATPLLASEMIDDIIPLPPNVRDIRRLRPTIDSLQRVYDSGLWKGTVDGLDAAMSSIWKPAQLLRGAYTVRVIGEEQVRMAGAGFDSMISNPGSAIAWSLAVDPKSKLGRKLANTARKVITPKGTRNVLGEDWDEVAEHAAAMSRGAAGHAGYPGEILTGRFVKANRDDPDFFRGWATELAHESNDPVMRRLSGGLKEGELRNIGGSTGNRVDDIKEWFWSAPGGKKFRMDWARIKGRGALEFDRQAADRYIDLFVDRLDNYTGGNPDLLEAVASGRIGDDLTLRGFGDEGKVSRLLEQAYSDAAPNYTKKPELLRSKMKTSGLNRVVDMGFDALMSKPTNWLSRSPEFRQLYWQRVSEVIGFADEATQKALLQSARDAGLSTSDDVFGAMVTKAARGGPGSRLTGLEDVDTLAKGFALDETRKLLYDLQKRSQFFDMLSVVFPFGEAWKEIIGAWTGILRKNPSVLRRFQQGLEGARAPSMLPGASPENEPGGGEGFFHPDPQTGEEVFTYPAGWAAKLLGVQDEQGAGVEFTGRAAGLNIVSATVLPGFGPAVQIPASHLIPQTPKWDDVRETLMPFGEERSVVGAVTPAWLEKLQTAFEDPENHRLFGNTVADVQRHLLNSGDYDIRSREGQQRLYDDAVAKARKLYTIRGLAQFGVPTGPSFSWSTEDLQGNIVPVKLLADDLRKLTNEEFAGDRQAAFEEWVKKYGVDNVLSVIGKSTALVERPVTEKGDAWLRAHPNLERDYETTIGYFAPEPAVGEFDYNAYLRQFETGAREKTTPTEQLALANDFLGRVQWERAKQLASIRPGPVTSTWLAQMREQIAEDYPGFEGWVSERVRAQRPSIDNQIAELRRAVAEPELANTDAGEGIRKYLSAVDAARQMVQLLPGNVRHYQEAKSARPVRDWLRAVAREITDQNPDFARVWTQVFERELADDDPVEVLAP